MPQEKCVILVEFNQFIDFASRDVSPVRMALIPAAI